MKKSVLLKALQQEIRRHDFNYFIHEPPSIAQGGKGVVAHWTDPRSIPMISAGIHIPLWPVNKLHITHHKQLPQLDMKDSMAALDRFCSTLGVCDLDAFIQP